MRAQLRDKSVCPLCFGTGVEIVRGGNYSYSRPCTYQPQAELPMDEPEVESKETVEAA